MKKTDKQPPGIMVYFELIPCLEQLSDECKGELFLAMLLYARDDNEPKFEHDSLNLLWPLFKNRIDNDLSRYNETCFYNKIKAKYNAYKSKAEKNGDNVLPFDEWKEREYPDKFTNPYY